MSTVLWQCCQQARLCATAQPLRRKTESLEAKNKKLLIGLNKVDLDLKNEISKSKREMKNEGSQTESIDSSLSTQTNIESKSIFTQTNSAAKPCTISTQTLQPLDSLSTKVDSNAKRASTECPKKTSTVSKTIFNEKSPVLDTSEELFVFVEKPKDPTNPNNPICSLCFNDHSKWTCMQSVTVWSEQRKKLMK